MVHAINTSNKIKAQVDVNPTKLGGRSKYEILGIFRYYAALKENIFMVDL